jgi:hypothetical protein
MLEVFMACMIGKIMPSACSPCRKIVDKILDDSGIRSVKRRRVPKRHAHGKALDEMSAALRIIHTWAAVQDGVGLVPKDVMKLTNKALAAYNAARIDIPQNAGSLQPETPEKSEP